MKKYFYISVLLFFVSSCQSEYKSSPTLWIASTRSIDRTIPYPYFLTNDYNSTNLLNYKGESIDSCLKTTQFIQGDTVCFESQPMKILHLSTDFMNCYILNDEHRFPIIENFPVWKNRSRFHKTLVGKKGLSQKIKSYILGNSFPNPVINENPNSDLEIQSYWIFDNDSLVTYYEYKYEKEIIYSEYHIKPLTFTEIDEQLFFSTNSLDDENPQMIYQILDITNKGIVIRYFDGSNEIIETLSKVNDVEISPGTVTFSRCFDGFQGEYYFYSNRDITYLHGNDYLLNMVNNEILISDIENGYINIHFTINCQGKVGQIGLEQMDFEYNKVEFSIELVKHLIRQVIQLKEWPSIQPEKWLEYKDVHGFLMFKIENGKITDVCP